MKNVPLVKLQFLYSSTGMCVCVHLHIYMYKLFILSHCKSIPQSRSITKASGGRVTLGDFFYTQETNFHFVKQSVLNYVLIFLNKLRAFSGSKHSFVHFHHKSGKCLEGSGTVLTAMAKFSSFQKSTHTLSVQVALSR